MLAALIITASACRRDMHDQPKFKPLQRDNFFTDGRSARPVPAHTVAWDELDDADAFHTGEANGQFLESIPLLVNSAVLHRGRDRYDIYCSPCHGRIGDGNGMVAQRGVHYPANFHTDRLRQVPPGYLFQVITNGYGGMGDYKDQVRVADRWAIVAYIRALQLSQNATLTDVPAGAASELGAAQ